MLAIEKDIAKVCDDALLTGRGVFTYAMYLRVNLVYKKSEGWTIIVVTMETPMAAMLRDGNSASLLMICSMIEKRLDSDLKFTTPEDAPTPHPTQSAWIVRSTGGPEPASTTEIDITACERIVRYARRDGQGKVTTGGWSLHLHKPDGRWLLEVAHVDRDETRDSISTKYYMLGQLKTTIMRLLRAPVDVQEPEERAPEP